EASVSEELGHVQSRKPCPMQSTKRCQRETGEGSAHITAPAVAALHWPPASAGPSGRPVLRIVTARGQRVWRLVPALPVRAHYATGTGLPFLRSWPGSARYDGGHRE